MQCFDQNFIQKTLQNAAVTIGPFYLKIYTKVSLKSAKTLMRAAFKVFAFSLFIVCQSSKTSDNDHFGRFFCYKQRHKEKFINPLSSSFCALEKYLCTNFQVKLSNGHGGVVEGRFFKILVKTLYFCQNVGPIQSGGRPSNFYKI